MSHLTLCTKYLSVLLRSSKAISLFSSAARWGACWCSELRVWSLFYYSSSQQVCEWVMYWAEHPLVQTPTRQSPPPRWTEEDRPERDRAAHRTPSPGARWCHCGCQPSWAAGSRRSRVVPGDKWRSWLMRHYVLLTQMVSKNMHLRWEPSTKHYYSWKCGCKHLQVDLWGQELLAHPEEDGSTVFFSLAGVTKSVLSCKHRALAKIFSA